MADTLNIGDLLAWARDWEQLLKAGPVSPGTEGYHVPIPVLQQYLNAANEALALQQRDQAPKQEIRSGGRPPGGMGETVMLYIANGMRESDALRIVANAFGKPIVAVAAAHARASKKTTSQPRAVTKKPRRRGARLKKTP